MKKKYDGPNQTDPYVIRKTRVFVSGLWLAASYNVAASYKIVVSCLALGLSLLFREWVDVFVILIASAQIVTAELMNSAIEEMCDYIQPGEDPKIGAVKDIAAAGAGVSMLIWVIVIFYQFYELVAYAISRGEVPLP